MNTVIKPAPRTRHVALGKELMDSPHRLSVMEKRLVVLLLEHVNYREPLNLNELYSADIYNYVEYSETSSHSFIEDLRTAALKLYNRSIDLYTSTGLVKMRWISEVQIDKDGDGLITVRWHPTVLEAISELHSRYTKIPVRDYFKLQSSYTIRLYEILRSKTWAGNSKVDIPFLDLLHMLDAPVSYNTFSLFKKEVLTPSLEEMETAELARVTYEVIRRRRKVVTVIFTCEY